MFHRTIVTRALLACLGLAALAFPGPAAAQRSSDSVPLGAPKLLIISRIGVRAPVESISMSRPTDYHAPYHWGDVAWYNRGPRPGQTGRANMYGHLDSTCCPAVFWDLKNLRAGDTAQVVYGNGQILTFQVRWQAVYWNNQLPMKFMYGPTRDRGLILMTCTGVFHTDGTGYDRKRIVYAVMR